MDTIQIIADDREQRSDILDLLTEREDISLTVERLPMGDYLIERK